MALQVIFVTLIMGLQKRIYYTADIFRGVILMDLHCVKCVQYGPEKTPYLDTFHVVLSKAFDTHNTHDCKAQCIWFPT